MLGSDQGQFPSLYLKKEMNVAEMQSVQNFSGVPDCLFCRGWHYRDTHNNKNWLVNFFLFVFNSVLHSSFQRDWSNSK